jgi:multiple sugar transport system substrate-binding protein
VIEYYSGGQPALDRAVTGWGVPLLKSMFDLLPQDTEFNQQREALMTRFEQLVGNEQHSSVQPIDSDRPADQQAA